MKVEDFAYHFLKNVTIRAEIAVAFYMSAWIEISKIIAFVSFVLVALYMSAWIEMRTCRHIRCALVVALHMNH
ncbi:hypothetical protein CEY02_04120 [Bacillus pumilus]|uniref:Uncharacterized protein n=1 Tax=Bacillus pumilus TaxID=1408 RepID=A0A2A5IYR4_BACPU|nr:hypothetical protein CEY02_04120 [Bacillus pumilus]